MESLYLWPANPAASLLALAILAQVFLYAARHPMHRAFAALGRLLSGGFRVAARFCKSVSVAIAQRDREMLADAGKGDAEARIAREFRRIEGTYAKELARYPDLHRRMDEVTAKIDADYKECGTAAPTPPGWAEATTAVAKMEGSGDRVVQKLLEEIHRSAKDSEKKALNEVRETNSKRHKILSGMAPMWKELKNLVVESGRSVTKALESTKRIDGYMDSYEKIRKSEPKAIRAIGWASTQLFIVSLLVLAIAIGGAFVNFNLIALPMSELVPSGSRIGGLPVSTVAALVIVLMEIAAGIFVMEMLGVTSFFPKLENLPSSRRRMILVVSLGGLVLLAGIECSLAVLREQIVASGTALKSALAGVSDKTVTDPASSRIPVIGQAVLGFILPFIIAMVAVPLETLIATGGHIALSLATGLFLVFGTLSRLLAQGARHGAEALRHGYDILIVIPLQIERIVQSNTGKGEREREGRGALRPQTEGRR